MKDLRKRLRVQACVFCLIAAAALGAPAICPAQEQNTPEAEPVPYGSEQNIQEAEPVPYGAEQPETVQSVPKEEPEVVPAFRELYEANRDLVGWLHVNETIDYPVVQRRDDNDYYLHHDFYGNDDGAGTLFVDGYNRIWPRDRALYIFGHNMKSGAAFGTLAAYDQEDYMRMHPLISFRTVSDEEDVYYAPVAGFHASMVETDPDYFFVLEPFLHEAEEIQRLSLERARAGLGTEEADDTAWDSILSDRIWARYEKYLNELLEHSRWSSPIETTVGDDLIILITCSYYQEDGRFILVCRKLRDNETPEMITQIYSGSAD